MTNCLWFRAKRYGWGWTPQTWEGWATLGVWLAVNVGWAMKIVHYYQADSDQLLRVVPVLIVTTLILIAICYKTGERPHWQWGGQRAD